MPKTFLRYGAHWSTQTDDLHIELSCIKRLGSWSDKGRPCGKGLPFHVKAAMKLLWPDMEWHRWAHLEVDEFLKSPGRTAVYGPSSSGKSFVLSRCGLVMFYARPQGTTVLISSTTLDALKRRVWDYVVSSDKQARLRFPWLPGSLIESKLMLLADPSTAEGRSFKDGIVGVACFSSGTPVDTPCGPIKIEDLKIGDEVFNALGIGRISNVFKRISEHLLRVHLSDGRAIDCTEEHPFLTDIGWIKARDLTDSRMVFSPHETMRSMRDSIRVWDRQGIQTEILPRMQLPASGATVWSMRENVPTVAVSNDKGATILLPSLQQPLGGRTQIMPQSNHPSLRILREDYQENAQSSTILLCVLPKTAAGYAMPNMRKKLHIHQRISNKRKVPILQQGVPPPIQQAAPQEKFDTNTRGAIGLEMLSGIAMELSCSHRIETVKRERSLVQSGCRISGHQIRGRNRWRDSLHTEEFNQGCRENENPRGTRVDRIEILESRSDKGFNESEGGYTVHNLEVEGHPSYSVNGVVVHNCKKGGQWQGLEEYVGTKNEVVILIADEAYAMPMGFLDSLANLESNENCYSAILGNLPDIHNPLGKAAEPRMGWESLADTEKTRVYETRWKNGRAVQLIGMDSPNLDFPEGQEPYRNLIGRRYIEQCAENYGRESDKFNMFASGKIPRASMNRSVITKSQCIKWHASDPVTWGHHKVVRGYGMDAAYSGVGGDRTVGFPFVFGKDNKNLWRLWIGPMLIYPGSDSPRMSHSEAIAMQCKQECDAHGIPPEHVFYDGTGRSELTSAFGRLWSPSVVPIEFGGPATERPSFTGERHLEGDDAGQHKTCREAFDRFVSELAFALRYCITSDQMRGLCEEAIEEGSQRRWEIVRGSKYCIETKTDMKERGLRSPDVLDGVVVCCEGARRLGFPLGKANTASSVSSTLWLKHIHEEEWERARKDDLVAA